MIRLVFALLLLLLLADAVAVFANESISDRLAKLEANQAEFAKQIKDEVSGLKAEVASLKAEQQRTNGKLDDLANMVAAQSRLLEQREEQAAKDAAKKPTTTTRQTAWGTAQIGSEQQAFETQFMQPSMGGTMQVQGGSRRGAFAGRRGGGCAGGG